jgi:hypothetical protein
MDLAKSTGQASKLIECRLRMVLLLLMAMVVLVISGRKTAVAQDKWDTIKVPGGWEDQSNGRLADYDGFGWYRCWVKVPDRWILRKGPTLWTESVTLSVRDVADVHEVYINGQKIGAAGSMPPKYQSGKHVVRRYKVPGGLFKQGVYNQIAVRVYNANDAGGFTGKAPVLGGYYLESVLAGQWEFRRGDDPTWASKETKERPKTGVYEKFSEANSVLQATEKTYTGKRLSPAESLKKMRVADDLEVDLMLHEPLIAQPLSMTFDARGRLWVVQYRQYPYPAGLKMISRDKYYRAVYDRVPPPPPHAKDSPFRGRDRISIHQDTNGDGKFDKHKVFVDGLNIATAVTPGLGGV